MRLEDCASELDGSLFWGHGDGLSVSGTTDPSIEDFSRLDFPYGKLYRINPLTGEGYEDNPFFTEIVKILNQKSIAWDFAILFALQFILKPVSHMWVM